MSNSRFVCTLLLRGCHPVPCPGNKELVWVWRNCYLFACLVILSVWQSLIEFLDIAKQLTGFMRTLSIYADDGAILAASSERRRQLGSVIFFITLNGACMTIATIALVSVLLNLAIGDIGPQKWALVTIALYSQRIFITYLLPLKSPEAGLKRFAGIIRLEADMPFKGACVQVRCPASQRAWRTQHAELRQGRPCLAPALFFGFEIGQLFRHQPTFKGRYRRDGSNTFV